MEGNQTMAIKITAKNNKLNGAFAGIVFKNGKATVDGTDAEKRRAIVFAERSGLDYEDTSVKEEVAKKAPAKK